MIVIKEKKEMKAFQDSNPFEILEEGKCMEVKMELDGEKFQATACRVDEDTVKIESDVMDYKGKIHRRDYEEGEMDW